MGSKICHVISLNVRGLRNKQKRSKLFLWNRENKCDILFLQETFWTADLHKEIMYEWNGPCFLSNGTNHARGVAVMIANHVDFNAESVIEGFDGRVVMINATIEKCKICLVNIYAPTEKKNRETFFKHLNTWIKENMNKEHKLIIAGDWNCVLNAEMDTKSGKGNYYKTPQHLRKLIKQFDLQDAWRKKNLKCKQFTWRNSYLNIASRLDYFMLDKSIMCNVRSCDIHSVQKFDHDAVSLKLAMYTVKKGPGFWKLNVQVLNESNYKNGIRKIIRSLDQSPTSYTEKWELIKIKCKEFSQKYSTAIKKHENELKTNLEKKIETLTRKIDLVEAYNKDLQKELLEAKTELDKIYVKKCKGAAVRARVHWIEEGEKNTKYFMNLEKRNAKKKNIHSLKKGDIKISTQSEVLQEVVNFYQNLYTSKHVKEDDLNNYFENVHVPFLSEKDKEMCEGKLTPFECKKAVFSMAKNKSPGLDGLPLEFYQVFWADIECILVNALNENFAKGVMSRSQKCGIISLIHKKDDEEDLKNWRPITLLNYDYKIMAMAIAHRIQKVLSTVVHENQVGYMKGRLSGFNIRLMQDLFQWIESEDSSMSGAVMFVDFTKAFDMIELDFIERALRTFNFGPDLLDWVKLMYKDIMSSVIVNGWTSEQFPLTRGIRQGCPLSALLFILAVEILASKLRLKKEIKGFVFQEELETCEIKVLQYADDTTLFLDNKKSMATALNELHEFGRVAGPSVNKSKTVVKWLSGNKNVHKWDISDFDLQWDENCVKYLGVYMGTNEKIVASLNWENKLKKIQRLVDNWRIRNLTYFGKVLIIKSQLVSQIVHILMYCSIPEYIIVKLNKIIFGFLWNTKTEKVKRNVVIRNYECGGLKMVDIRRVIHCFRLKWLGLISNESVGAWKTICKLWFRSLGGMDLLLNCNYDNKVIRKEFEKKIPSFYVELLQAWLALRKNGIVPSVNHTSQILWYNEDIQCENNTLYFKHWYKSGIIFLHDIFKNNGFIDVALLQQMLKNRFAKANVIFDYSKLRNAVPKFMLGTVGKNVVKDNAETLNIPLIFFNNKLCTIGSLKTKQFHCLLENKEIEQPQYWTKRIEKEINWNHVFRRCIIKTKENKLKEFYYKILYNLLPTRRNLFLWKLRYDDVCETCQCVEDIQHAFFNCRLNHSFYQKISLMYKQRFDKNIDITEEILFKEHVDNQLHDILTVALWSIHKLITLRNVTGKDDREKGLWNVFCNEILIRIKTNQIYEKKGRKPLYHIPHDLRYMHML